MKRIFITLLAAFAVILSADAESSYQAAIRFFCSDSGANRVRQNTSRVRKVSADMGGVAVYNRDGGGFVMMAEKDGQWDVIGYSETETFDVDATSTPVMRDLFDNGAVGAGIRKVSGAGSPVKGPYITTQWNQGEPFNNLCPYDTVAQRRMWAGCTTTALAQLFNYYRSPSHSAYHRFDWDNMRDKYEPGSYTDEEANAVATLYADLAQEILNVNFSVEESGGLFPYYCDGYSVIRVYKDNWVDFLNQTDKPQILHISAINTARQLNHAVIMDGIDSNGFWHINWGWGGSCDGWYKPNYFEAMYGGEDAIWELSGRYAENQRFLNPDPDSYLPGMKVRGGIKMEPQQPKAGDQVTVTLSDLGYVNTNCWNFSFQKDYGSSFRLALYYPFPWRTTGNVYSIGRGGYYYNWDYNPSYVGQELPLESLPMTDTKYKYNYTGKDVTLTFTMPELPDGQDMILRPEYYLYWFDGVIHMRRWPDEDTYTMAPESKWTPFPSYIGETSAQSPQMRVESAAQIENCFILHKNSDGSYTATPSSVGEMAYTYGLPAGIESISLDRPAGDKEIVGYYTVDGIRSSSPRKGLNIVVYSDGTASKKIF